MTHATKNRTFNTERSDHICIQLQKTVVKNAAYGALITDKGEVTEVEGFADLLD